MCKIRTLIIDTKGGILDDRIITLVNLALSVIDTPALCIFSTANANGYENIIFKYSNIVEKTLSVSSKSSKTIMTVGRNSGCVYTFQHKGGIGLSEVAEMREVALAENDNARYQRNVRLHLRLLKQIYEDVAISNPVKSKRTIDDKAAVHPSSSVNNKTICE